MTLAFFFIFFCLYRDDDFPYASLTWPYYLFLSGYILLMLGIVFWACPVYVTYERINRWPDCATSWWPMQACMDESAQDFIRKMKK